MTSTLADVYNYQNKILLIALIFEKIRIIIIAIVTLILYGTYPCFIHSKNFKEIKNQEGTVGNIIFLLGGGDQQIGRLARRHFYLWLLT